MKKTILKLVALVCFVSTSFITAQSTTEASNKKVNSDEIELYNRIGLSELQIPQFKEIQDKYEGKIESVMQSRNPFKIRRSMKKLIKEKNAEMRKILSDPQYDEYLKFEEEMKQKMKQKMKNGGMRRF